MRKNRLKHILNKMINISFYICLLFIAFILLQIFLFSSFRIPSDSMEPSLQVGDHIIVNKLVHGARIFDLNKAINDQVFNVKRTYGFGRITYNDVLVFNFPYPKSSWDSISFDIMSYYVKRCIALPGDTLTIRDGYYKLLNKTITPGNLQSQKRISLLTDSCGHIVMNTFPLNNKLNWTIKQFGPLAIPTEGQIVEMDSLTYILYHQIISWEQRKKLRLHDKRITLEDSVITHYRFTHNYYFVSGDKMENSQDSRYWGLLPEDYIVGKATTIWKSKDPNGNTRWDRILKRIE